jgi:SAM-dependent methyltransferase
MDMIETINGVLAPSKDTMRCPVCMASNYKEWGMRSELMMYECQSCGVVFFNRKQFELHDYENYYDYTDNWDDARVAWEINIRRGALRKQLAQMGKYVEGRRLLDVGAGPGYLCRVATDEGWESYGIELSEKALRIGREFLQVQYIEIEDVAEASLDVITCHHVLEHMERPDEFIKSLRSKLKTGGIIAVHVPHREPLSFIIRNRLDSMRGRQAEKLCALYAPEHINGFTPASLVKTFGLFGFEPLMVRTAAMWSMYYDPFFFKNYLREKNYTGIFKHTLRSMVDNVGVLAGLGDWVVAHFRKI